MQDSTTTSEFPKTLRIRNEYGGMLWQVYHVNSQSEAAQLENGAHRKGFYHTELVDYCAEQRETFPGWRREASMSLDDEPTFDLTADQLNTQDILKTCIEDIEKMGDVGRHFKSFKFGCESRAKDVYLFDRTKAQLEAIDSWALGHHNAMCLAEDLFKQLDNLPSFPETDEDV